MAVAPGGEAVVEKVELGVDAVEVVGEEEFTICRKCITEKKNASE